MSEDEDREYQPGADDTEINNSSDEEVGVFGRKPAFSRTNASPVWEFFDKLSGGQLNRARCRMCHLDFSFKSTTANLKSHLKRKHGVEVDKRPTLSDANLVLIKDRRGVMQAGGGFSLCYLFRHRQLSPTNNPNVKAWMDANELERVQEIKVEPDDGKRRSAVWRWFAKYTNGQVSCRICKKFYNFRTTTTLKNHLESVHPGHFKQYSALYNQKNGDVNTGISDVENDKTCQDHLNTAVTTEPCVCPSVNGVTEHKDGCTAIQMPCFWDYFEKIEQDTAVCRICSNSVSWAEDVDELRRHLEKEHPDVPVDKEAPDDILQDTHEVLLEEALIETDDEPIMRSSGTKRKQSDHHSPHWSKRIRRERGRVTNISHNDNNEDYNSSLDRFGLYAASLMRFLPKDVASKFQLQIIERLMQEKMKYS